MDFLDPSSPVHAQKQLERAIYLRDWAPFVAQGARVLDVGGGIGRFAVWCLERGCSVAFVEADPLSLERAVAHTGGRIDAFWTTAERLPPLDGFDVAIACELLCYVESPEPIVADLRERLEPGGVLLASVEARNGWVAASDAAPRIARIVDDRRDRARPRRSFRPHVRARLPSKR